MDPDQHRQKRSRVRSADADNDLSQRDNVEDDRSEQGTARTQGRLATTTRALKNIFLKDQDPKAQVKASHVKSKIPTNSLQLSISQPASATFSACTSSHNDKASNVNTGSPSAHNHSNTNHAPASATLQTTKAASGSFDLNTSLTSNDSSQSKKRTEHVPQPVLTLPFHGARERQPTGKLVVGPSTRQLASDASKAVPGQNLPHWDNSLATDNLARPADGAHTFSGEASLPSERKSARPRAIYMPASVGNRATNPDSYRDSESSIKPASNNHELQKPLSSAAISQPEAKIGAGIPKITHPRPSQNPVRFAAQFPYPSIYPANERIFRGEDATFPRSPPGYPPNHYTSPNRVPNAALIASRKRKRGWPALPPPAYIYTRSDNPDFNVFDGILLFPELCFALAANLPLNALVSLYAISKDFHTIIDTRFTTVIRSQALRKCPESSSIFPYRCYKNLCRDDPAPRIPHPHPIKQEAGEIRKVPSFRWLRMILFRDMVCHEIVTIMAEDGVPLPGRCEVAMKKMWFLMDIPDNARRIGYMHIRKHVSDIDLYFMMCFLVKFVLRLNDPVGPNRYHGLRKILLSQRGLAPIWRALKRRSLLTRYDVLKMWIATRYDPSPGEEDLTMFGIPGQAIGKTKMEYCGGRSTHDNGKPCTILLRPDQLVMREIVRRKMIFSKHFLRCMLSGYLDFTTFEKYPSQKWDRRIEELDDEYGDDDECGERAEGGNDELLDLAIKKPISVLVSPRGDNPGERQEKTKADVYLEECVNWYRREQHFDMDMDGT